MTEGVIVPNLQPKMVTLAELKRILLPLCFGWSWAEDAIVDLWKLGTPVPVAPHAAECRILFPMQFQKWYVEIQQRMGLPVQPADMYGAIAPRLRYGSGQKPGKGE